MKKRVNRSRRMRDLVMDKGSSISMNSYMSTIVLIFELEVKCMYKLCQAKVEMSYCYQSRNVRFLGIC